MSERPGNVPLADYIYDTDDDDDKLDASRPKTVALNRETPPRMKVMISTRTIPNSTRTNMIDIIAMGSASIHRTGAWMISD